MDLSQRFNKQLDRIEVSMIQQFDQSISDILEGLKLTLGEPWFWRLVASRKQERLMPTRAAIMGMAGLPALREVRLQNFGRKIQFILCARQIRFWWPWGDRGPVRSLVVSWGGDTVFCQYRPPWLWTYCHMVGADIVEIGYDSHWFRLDAWDLRANLLGQGDKLKAVILNYPANPTGVTYSREQIQAFAGGLEKYPILSCPMRSIWIDLYWRTPCFHCGIHLPSRRFWFKVCPNPMLWPAGGYLVSSSSPMIIQIAH